MVQKMVRRRYWILAGLWLALVLGLAGCGPEAQMLRVANHSGWNISRLVVLFPDERIDFGAIPAGATSEYKPVPHGVYSYAAYEVELDGRTYRRPVMDWVGEKPMVGLAFTYVVDVDLAQVILLKEVKRDRP